MIIITEDLESRHDLPQSLIPSFKLLLSLSLLLLFLLLLFSILGKRETDRERE